MPEKIRIALIDDHVLLRAGLASLINSFGNCMVLLQADHGKDFIDKLEQNNMPDIVLLDISLPVMDGFETCKWIRNNYPVIKILVLSVDNNEISILKMFREGARGYISKDCDPEELKTALQALEAKGFYYSEVAAGTFMKRVNEVNSEKEKALTERETTFLKWACTELTYKEIANNMQLSPRTIDGYREELFRKLRVKTRVGLALYAIKNGIVKL